MEHLESRCLYSVAPLGAIAPLTVTAISLDGTPINRAAAPVTRSRITTLSFQFSRDVSASLDASDLTLRNLNTNQIVPASTLTFSYDPVTLIGQWTVNSTSGSLADGRCLALLNGAGVLDANLSPLDGDGNGVPGGSLAFGFSRLFGDVDGNGIVATPDRNLLLAALPSIAGDSNFDARFDFDGDLAIGASDQSAFDARFNTSLAKPAPTVPTGLSAIPLSGTEVLVGWSSTPGDAAAVRLERATVATGPFISIGVYPAGSVSRRDTGLIAGKKYWYRVVATNPFGTSAASPVVSVWTISAPKLKAVASRLYLTDAVDGLASGAKSITLTNSGTGSLLIQPGGITLSGTEATEFSVDVGSVPILLSAGQSTTVRVRMNASVIGIGNATLRIASNDVTGVVAQFALRGLGTDPALAGPSLQQILDLNSVPMTLSRPSLTLGGTIPGETALQLLTKAGPGPVTIQPLGVAADHVSSAQIINMGWYVPGATLTRNPLFSISSVDRTSVAPLASGALQFDPGGATFGLYADWPGIGGRLTSTEDVRNGFESIGSSLRKFRFYALRTTTGGIVANAYVMTAEVTYVIYPRTVVMIVRNLRNASLPIGWQSEDVGAAAMAGSASLAGTTQPADGGGTYTVVGGGSDVGATDDTYHYAYRKLTGDGTITARVASQSGSLNPAAGAGIMLRSSIAPSAAQVTLEMSAAGDVTFRYAANPGDVVTSSTSVAFGAPGWVRLVRTGNLITGYASLDGVNWVSQGSTALAAGVDVFVGLAVTSRDSTTFNTAIFDNVQVTPAAAAGRAAVVPQIEAPDKATGLVTIGAMGTDASISARLLVDGVFVGSSVPGVGPYQLTWNSQSVLDGSHTLAVQTTDRFGNIAKSSVGIAVVNPDLPPDVRFDGLGSGDVLTGVVNLHAVATDERGVVNVQYFMDGVAIGAFVLDAPYNFLWNTGTRPEGWHTMTVVARDTRGNKTISPPIKVRIANVNAPTSAEITGVTIPARRTQTSPWTNYGGQVIPRGLRLETAPRSLYGGDTTQQFAATGFFRTQKINNRWWIIDPSGYRYFDNSVIAVQPNIFPNNAQVFLDQFGAGDVGNTNWALWVRGWLQDIGVYTSAWTGSTVLRQSAPMNYNLVLDLMNGFGKSIGSVLRGTGHSNYTNDAMPVFDPRFAQYCNDYFTNVMPTRYPGFDPKNDPYLVGYMTDNELPWTTSTLDNYLTLPAGDANRAAAETWLQARGSTIPSAADRTDFLSYVSDTYFRVTSNAIRAYDPNHLLLGARFLAGDGTKAYLYKSAKPYVDIASINYYDGTSPGSVLGSVAAKFDMPFMVTEFYAKGVDSGLSNRAGYGLTVRTQADRGAYYQSLALSMLGSRNGVGISWLSLMDNNSSNPFADPSNTDSNKGLMPINYPLTQADNPYEPLTSRIKDLNANVYALINLLTP